MVEQLQYSIYVNDEDYQSLAWKSRSIRNSDDVSLWPSLSRKMSNTLSRLALSRSCRFTREELNWLLCEAMRDETDPAERQIWYDVARDIAFSQLRGKRRQQALATLTAGVDGPARADDIKTRKDSESRVSRQNRDLKQKNRARKAENDGSLRKTRHSSSRRLTLYEMAVAFPVMQRLFSYAAESSSPIRYTKVSLEPILRDFGHELAEAFSEGLTKVWRQISVPNPADYPANRVPWVGLIGLASVNHAFAKGLDVRSLSTDDITRAMQLCVWEIERPEPWLEELVDLRLTQLQQLLCPGLIRTRVGCRRGSISADGGFRSPYPTCIAAALPAASIGANVGQQDL